MLSNNNTQGRHLFRQLIILDEELEFVGSDDTLFSTEKLKEISVAKWFPFIESIHETLKKMKIGKEEVLFSRVESPADFLPGSYDFAFFKVEQNGRKYIQWSIYDYTVVYSYLSKYQQLKNEKDIYRQKLEYRDRQKKDIKDFL
ncbi:MAG: hypothetical protein AB8F94_03775 [Saprospiraceae bacterium]